MARLRRWELQNHAAKLAGAKDRVRFCLRNMAYLADGVEIRYRPAKQTARYTGLQTCGSVWHCPICAAKISEQRRSELARIVEAHIAAGGSVWMTTYTIRHKKFNDLADLLKRFLEARRVAKGGNAGIRLRRDFQIIGTVSVLEVTWSKENGWHPHVHELVFSMDPNFDPEKFDQVMRAVWRSAAKSQGLKMNGHGFQIDRTYGAVADYIAKFGHEPMSDKPWGVESEITKGHIKRGRMERHLTPFAILDAIADGCDELIPRWQEYAQVFKGRKQLNYSPGLKAMYQVEETEDEELAALADVEQDEEFTLVRPSPGQWETIVEKNVRGNLLELARVGRVGELVEGLAEIGVEVEPLLQSGWRVSTPGGDATLLSVKNESTRGRWRCSVLLDQAENAQRWRAFDLVEIVVIGGPSPGLAKAS